MYCVKKSMREKLAFVTILCTVKDMKASNIAVERDTTVYDFYGALEVILQTLKEYYPTFTDEREEKVRRAYWYGFDAHRYQKRFSGEPYFMHPVEATKILLTIRPDIDTVCACLLHDVIEDTPISADEIEKEFGREIRFLCEGVEKVSKVNLREDQKGQKMETLKKLFLAVAKDIRVIFVKLADRIHNLSTLQHVRPEKRNRIARESQEIYAPVAEKLGLNEFKIRINDLCLEHLHPAAHRMILEEMAEHFDERKAFVLQAKNDLLDALRKRKINVLEIKGRPKNIASIYGKMKRKNLNSISEIYDLTAFRIVVNKPSTCYRVLGELHSRWSPMPGRFKDYISVPKPNGYQSLHTTILGLANSKLPTEIQIRTQKMHLDAEFGPAAHWAYKKRRTSNFDKDYVKRTEWFPTAISADEEDVPADKFYEQISARVLADRIYVFTPKGDTITLREGSTPVDFAYAVHSKVGDTIVGAKVNGVMRPISTPLENGQIIEILTRKDQTPKEAWLDFVKSTNARQHINAHLNRERKKIDPDYDAQKVNSLKKTTQARLQDLAKVLPVKPPKPQPKTGNTKEPIFIGGSMGMPYRMASCCTIVPGDPIVAYKSRGLDFTLHHKNCETLEGLEPERMMDATYFLEQEIRLSLKNRVGLLRDMLALVSDQGINIRQMHTADSPKGQQHSSTTLYLQFETKPSFEQLLTELKHLDGVEGVTLLS